MRNQTMTIPSARRGRAARSAALLLMLVVAQSAEAAQTQDDTGEESLSGTYLAARTAVLEKDYPSAAGFYQSASGADPDNLFLLERALVMTSAGGDVADALPFGRRLVKKAPTSHAGRLILAIDDIRNSRFAAAADALTSSGAGDLADLTSALLVAWARFGDKQTDKALADLDKLKGESWYEPFKLLHGGYIALAAGRIEQAVELLGQARSRDPNAIRISEAYARALAAAGRKKESEGVLQDFLARFPDNPLAHSALADIRAGSKTKMVSTPLQGAAEALAGLGAAVGQEGGLEVATLYLNLALYLDPQTAGGLAAVSLGTLLDASGQGEAAIKAFDTIGPQEPFRGLGALRSALALDRMDRTAEAERAFKEAVTKTPDDVQTYISYGNMLRGRERFTEAAEIYTKAVEKIAEPNEGDWSLFYFRGIAYERTKVWEKAQADFRQALKLDPDQPLVLNYLGYSWVDMGRNLDEAMNMIRKAVELRPNDGYIVDSLGWAQYRLGRYEDAVTELERAVSLRPEDPVIHDHLGDAYWKTGRTLEAQFQWRHARDFGAEGPELELILRKIAEGRLIEEKKASLNSPASFASGQSAG